ncbi:stage II sporulation protein R [Paenibacillus endophyticus]|uniref:Stage II sporulation protein R n=1 Tax=Paenibacillus endophyticus TaxID=1294268 RepID=A0A7W5CBA1_9BACL|nr:stage II sporulation protein R [Paenibacillus endophyticus]MBB3154548.1 stage II sporulation protein R [Paenibacillus endophyticus]
MSSHFSIHSYSNVEESAASKSVAANKYSYRKSYGFIVFAIILLIMSWEAQQMDAAVAGGQIPQEAIRLRILANSDRPADQLVKRLVRDEIVKAMSSWATGPQTIEEARQSIMDHMPEIERITATVLQSRGFGYGASAELGIVPFPTKMYGNEVYPAGDYEALRITLGEGGGQNWWCVLFPPLCFIDAASGEAAASASVETPAQTTALEADSVPVSAAVDMEEDGSSGGQAPEAKFFLLEMIQSLINWIKSLFA